jgi:hypothetical protein
MSTIRKFLTNPRPILLLLIVVLLAALFIFIKYGFGERGGSVDVSKFPAASVMVPPNALLKFTKKVSLGSLALSPITVTVTVFEVWPGVKESEVAGIAV